MSAGAEHRGRPVGAGPARISAGRVGRAHGLDGSFYVTRAKPRLLTVGARVAVGGRDARIERRAGTEERPILRLEGIGDRDSVESLRGEELVLDALQAPALAEGEWWEHELQGCEVRAGERVVGTVTRLIELPSCEALEVQAPGSGARVLVPMVKAAVRAVDVAAGRIEVDLEFLDLDARPDASGEGDR